MTLSAHASSLLQAQLRRIRIGTFALILTLGMLFAGYEIYDYRAQMQQTRAEALEIAGTAANNAQAVVKLAQQVLAGMGEVLNYSPDADTPHSLTLRNTLLGWRNRTPYLMDLLVVEPPGRIVHWTGPGEAPDVADREYISHHMQHADSGLYVGPPQLSRVRQGRWFFGVSEAQRDPAGQVQRVLVVIVDMEAIRTSLEASGIARGNTVALISQSGVIYTRTPDHALYVGKQLARPPEAASIAPGSLSGAMALNSPLDGKQRMIAFRRLKEQGLFAIGTIDMNEAMSPWRERIRLLAGLWLVLAAIVVWFARRLSAAAREHETLANTDGLTGVLNRRSLLGLAEGAERRIDSDQQLAVLMIDIDHFKKINDSLGHAAGDAVLRQVAEVLRDSCRDSDLVGRYGGEEFLAILSDTSEQGALNLAEKLRRKVAEIGTSPCPVTVSIGVAVCRPVSGTLNDAIRRADQAMYAAKAAGRNRVVLDAGPRADAVPHSAEKSQEAT